MSLVRTKKTSIPVSRTKREVGLQSSDIPFSVMQQNMEHELESRRLLWEQDVAKMSQDFFQLNPGDQKKDDKSRDVELDLVPRENIPDRFPVLRAPGSEIIDIHNADTLYTLLEDGRKVYRLRFDVRGFEPEEIKVRVEGRKLAVSAKHEEDMGLGRKSCREFNRKMDFPEEVDDLTINAHLSTDGILMVEGDLDPTKVKDVKSLPAVISENAVKAIYGMDQLEQNRPSQAKLESGFKALTNDIPEHDGLLYQESSRRIPYIKDHADGIQSTSSRYQQHHNHMTPAYPVSSRHVAPAYSVSSRHVSPAYHVSSSHVAPAYPVSSRRVQCRYHPPMAADPPYYDQRRTDINQIIASNSFLSRGVPVNRLHTSSTAVTDTPNSSKLEPNFHSDMGSAFRSVSPALTRPEMSTLSRMRPTFGRFTDPLVVISHGQRKLKLCVHLGGGYEAKDIVVKCKNGTLGIYAEQEKSDPWHSKREFSREFELPESIEVETLVAMLTKEGQIRISSSIQGNSNHQVIIDSIKSDMPVDAEPLRLEVH